MIDGKNDEKQVELIAEKSRKAAYVFLALTVLGVAVAVAGALLLIYVDTQNSLIWELCILSVGVVMLATFGGLYIGRLFRPYALITLENGKIKLPDGSEFNPNEITSVERDKDKITITVDGGKKEISGVANCDKAYRKLCVLTGNPA